MNATLAPCKHCGSTHPSIFTPVPGAFFVKCWGCGSSIPGLDAADATSKWNRAPDRLRLYDVEADANPDPLDSTPRSYLVTAPTPKGAMTRVDAAMRNELGAEWVELECGARSATLVCTSDRDVFIHHDLSTSS